MLFAAIGADEAEIEASVGEAIRIATCERKLRSIPPPKSERVKRTWIPITSLVTSCCSLAFVQPKTRSNSLCLALSGQVSFFLPQSMGLDCDTLVHGIVNA